MFLVVRPEGIRHVLDVELSFLQQLLDTVVLHVFGQVIDGLQKFRIKDLLARHVLSIFVSFLEVFGNKVFGLLFEHFLGLCLEALDLL